MANGKEILKGLLGDLRKKKDEEEKERSKKNDEDRTKVLEGVGGDLAKSLEPALQALANNSQMNEEQLRNAFQEAMQINMPPVDTESISNAIREAITESISQVKINVPEVKVNVPETKFPEIKFPETKYPTSMSVGLENYTNKTPLAVRLFDHEGKPFQFSFPSIGGGGKSDFFTIKAFAQSAFSELTNPDGRVKVELPTGSSGLTDTELRASAVPVIQVSGGSWSTSASIVSVTDIFSTTSASAVVNPDNRVRVELPAGASGLTDAELRASAVPILQVSGAADSVNVISPVNQGDAATAIRVIIAGNSDTSTVVNSGTLTGITNTITTNQLSGAIDSVNVLTMPAVVVTSVTNTIAAANVDSSGVQYSGSNPLPITVVSSALTSTIAVGSVVADAVDDGSAPVQGGGIARTANPTAVAGGDVVKSTHDDLGRQVMRPLQVRDLIQTAYVSVTNGTETTLRAAVAGAFLDLIMIVASNNSDAAVSVDIRPVTGGNIINTLRIPANGTAGFTPAVPWPQSEQGNNWTVDGPDETGRTLTFSALFSQEL